jgi:20S proteasome subunit alpha 4
VRLTVKALLEVVDSGSKNMEVAVITYGNPMRLLPEEELQGIISDIEREQEEAKRSAQGTEGNTGADS